MTTRIAGARCPQCGATAFEIEHGKSGDDALFICLTCDWRGPFAALFGNRGKGGADDRQP